MNPNQLIAFEKCEAILYQRLGSSVDEFSNYLQAKGTIKTGERRKVEEKKKISDVDALALLFEWMKAKDGGWTSTIDFLKTNDFGTLAIMLESAEGSTDLSNSMTGTSHDDILVSFKSKLVEYYKTDYCKVPTLFGCHKEVGKIWVPLQIEDKTRSLRQDEIFHHQELLNRLTRKGSSSIAIVSGDPGGGKTTLVKKIVLDWANNKIQQFSVVLAVPLRYMSSKDDCHNWLQMTVDYYTKQLELSEDTKLKLLNALNELKHKLLICLDGLDEYSRLAQSPFKSLFQYPNSNERTENPLNPPPSFNCKILLTSRPYACEVKNPDFFPLKLKIVSLDEAGLHNFISFYCETNNAVEKVTKYLEQNAKWVGKVPLILVFVCSLADLPNRIPRNLTLLYETLLDNMIERETKGNRRIQWPEGKKPPNWKDLDVVKWTSTLAFDGCKNKTFAFQLNDLENYEMTQDSFTCGFLLRQFDFSQLGLSKIAEFPHRSIQEFFAALHCYQMISAETSATGESERYSVLKEIFNHDSQFRRFFFGLCSQNGHFEKMIEWLQPTFEDARLDLLGINKFIEILSDSLSDCTEVDAVLLGDSLAASVDQLQDQILAGGNQKIGVSWPRNLTSINKSFQQGLNLNFFDENKRNWYLPLVDDSRWARLAYVDMHTYPSVVFGMRNQLDRIDIFKWEWNISKLDGIKASLDRLPPIFILNVTVDHSVDLEINFDLKYNININPKRHISATALLQKFTFGFPKDPSNIRELKEKFSDKFDSHVIAGETKITGENGEIRSLTVTIRKIIDQSQLLKALVRLALKISLSSEKKEITLNKVETRLVQIFVPLAIEMDSFRENLKVDHRFGTSFLISRDIELKAILTVMFRELASCENEDTKKRVETSLKMLLTVKSSIASCKDLEDINHFYSLYDDSHRRRRHYYDDDDEQRSWQHFKIFIWKHSLETQLALEIVFFCQDMRDWRKPPERPNGPKLPKYLYQEGNRLQNYANEESLEETIISLFHSRLKSAAVIIPYGSKVNLKKSYYRIELFPWNFNLAKMMSLLDRLSPVFTEIIVVSSYLADFEVTINLEDVVDAKSSDGTRLQNFTLRLNRRQIPNMKELKSDQPDIQHLIIEEKKTDARLTIKIKWFLDRSVSVGSLVRLALERIIAA